MTWSRSVCSTILTRASATPYEKAYPPPPNPYADSKVREPRNSESSRNPPFRDGRMPIIWLIALSGGFAGTTSGANRCARAISSRAISRSTSGDLKNESKHESIDEYEPSLECFCLQVILLFDTAQYHTSRVWPGNHIGILFPIAEVHDLALFGS